MGNALELRYRRFAAEFFVDCDPCAAYRRSGFKAKTPGAIRTNAARLLASDSMQPYLAEEFARLQARLELQQDRGMLEICRLAYSDLRGVASWGPDGMELVKSDDIPDDVAAAVQDVKSKRKTRSWVGENGMPITQEEVDTQIKLHSKLPALEMLQEFFRRGDPLSAEAEAKVHALLMIMAQYVPRDRLDAFRAHVRAAFGIDIPDSDDPGPCSPGGSPKMLSHGPDD